eukprot:PhM_4_TR10554/c0_g1_i1/m.52600
MYNSVDPYSSDVSPSSWGALDNLSMKKSVELEYMDALYGDIGSVVLHMVLALLFFAVCTSAIWEFHNVFRGPSSSSCAVVSTCTPLADRGDLEEEKLRGILRHVAIVMDGNRRYGRAKCGSALAGHYHGANKLLEVMEWCMELDISALTVYAFSTENWKREKREVDTLMRLFEEYFEKVLKFSIERNVQVHFLCSERELLPPHIIALMDKVEGATTGNTGLIFNACVSYGGRSELTAACRRVVAGALQKQKEAASPLDLSELVNEETLSQQMLTAAKGGDPELILRTSGESRLSNFLLWQCAYAELTFVPQTWPEVTRSDFLNIVADFGRRARRFGK